MQIYNIFFLYWSWYRIEQLFTWCTIFVNSRIASIVHNIQNNLIIYNFLLVLPNSVEEWFRVLIVKMYVVCSINTLKQKLKSAFSCMLNIYSTNSIITQHKQDPCLSGSQKSGNFKRIIFNKPVKSVAYVIKSQFAFSCKFNSSEFGLICFLPLICVKDD